ncbi:MAG: hypothetical protein ABI175_05235 [Polyangiales bacterium]
MIGIKAILIFASLIVAGAGAVGNALWGPRARARKRLDAATRTTIADHEIVTLTGVVRAIGELLEAPLSGKRCVLYESVGRVYGETVGRNARNVEAEVTEQKLIPFDLETPEGVVRVEAEQAEVEMPRIPCIPRRIDRERTFLLEHGQSAEMIRYAGFDELRIVPGDKIRVQGMAIIDADPRPSGESGYREGAPQRIRLVPHADHPLTIGRARR